MHFWSTIYILLIIILFISSAYFLLTSFLSNLVYQDYILMNILDKSNFSLITLKNLSADAPYICISLSQIKNAGSSRHLILKLLSSSFSIFIWQFHWQKVLYVNHKVCDYICTIHIQFNFYYHDPRGHHVLSILFPNTAWWCFQHNVFGKLHYYVSNIHANITNEIIK